MSFSFKFYCTDQECDEQLEVDVHIVGGDPSGPECELDMSGPIECKNCGLLYPEKYILARHGEAMNSKADEYLEDQHEAAELSRAELNEDARRSRAEANWPWP